MYRHGTKEAFVKLAVSTRVQAKILAALQQMGGAPAGASGPGWRALASPTPFAGDTFRRFKPGDRSENPLNRLMQARTAAGWKPSAELISRAEAGIPTDSRLYPQITNYPSAEATLRTILEGRVPGYVPFRIDPASSLSLDEQRAAFLRANPDRVYNNRFPPVSDWRTGQVFTRPRSQGGALDG